MDGCREFERDDGIWLKEIRVKNRVMMCLCRKKPMQFIFWQVDFGGGGVTSSIRQRWGLNI